MTRPRTRKPGHERLLFLSFEAEAAGFQAGFSRLIQALLRANDPLPAENQYRMTHGRSWKHPAAETAIPGEIQTHSATTELSFQDIVDGKLERLSETIAQVAEDLKKHFYTSLYEAVSHGAEAVGNVVSAQDAGSFAAGFLESLRRIEFGVDRNGEVKLPEIHVGPGMAEKLMAELEAQSDEYKNEVERVKAEKIEQALKREHERREKFVRYIADG